MAGPPGAALFSSRRCAPGGCARCFRGADTSLPRRGREVKSKAEIPADGPTTAPAAARLSARAFLVCPGCRSLATSSGPAAEQELADRGLGEVVAAEQPR